MSSATITVNEATIMEWRLDSFAPMGPQASDPMNAPRIMNDEMIC